jgi:hypothetical protein
MATRLTRLFVFLGFAFTLTMTLNVSGRAQVLSPPQNDQWSCRSPLACGAAVISPTPYSISENTVLATSSTSDPVAPCDNGEPAGSNFHTVWFKYTPTVSGTLTVNTEGSNYANTLSAWTGTPTTAWTNVACGLFISEFDFNSQISFHADAGTTYSIMSQCYNGAASCTAGTLDLAATIHPDNDFWTGRYTLLPPTSQLTEDTSQATVGSEDPTTGCTSGFPSVWFTYTPSASGMVFASTQNSDYSSSISIWTGSPGAFVEQNCNSFFYFNGAGNQGMAPFYGLAGIPYSVMVQSRISSTGNGGHLQLTFDKQDLLPSAVSLGFTKQAIGTTSATKTITIKNQNSNTLIVNTVHISANFNLMTNTCTGATLGPAATCSLGVSFTPSNPGTLKGSVAVFSAPNGSSPGANNSGVLVNLSGTGAYPMTFNVSSVAFPVTPVGTTSAQKSVTLSNNTAASIPLGTRSVSDDFSASDNCGTALGAHASCTFLLSFSPNRPVGTSGVLTVPASAIFPQPVYLGLTGTGSGAVSTQVSVTTSVTFANEYISVPSPQKSITVTNNGGSGITLHGDAIYGPFGVLGGTCTTLTSGVLNGGTSCTYTVEFIPNRVGAFRGAFTVFDTDPTVRQVVGLVGTGLAAVSFTPASVSLGTLRVGTQSAPTTITIKNNTTSGINNFGLALSTDYLLTGNTCPLGGTLGANSTCTATFVFQTSVQGGSVFGSLAVTGSQTGAPHLLNLGAIGN